MWNMKLLAQIFVCFFLIGSGNIYASDDLDQYPAYVNIIHIGEQDKPLFPMSILPKESGQEPNLKLTAKFVHEFYVDSERFNEVLHTLTKQDSNVHTCSAIPSKGSFGTFRIIVKSSSRESNFLVCSGNAINLLEDLRVISKKSTNDALNNFLNNLLSRLRMRQ